LDKTERSLGILWAERSLIKLRYWVARHVHVPCELIDKLAAFLSEIKLLGLRVIGFLDVIHLAEHRTHDYHEDEDAHH
jgi:hypothetical protein